MSDIQPPMSSADPAPSDAAPTARTLTAPDCACPQEDRVAAILAALGLLVTALCGYISPDGLFHFDDLTHYLYARWAWQWPAYLLDEWGRPGFTALYALPAYFGWAMCRGFSAILSAWSAWFAYRIARGAGLRYAWAVVPLCFIQPLFFQLAQTTLTETALAFYLTTAVYLAQRGRWSLGAAVLSVALLTRHEAAVFVPVWVFVAWRQGVPLWRHWPLVWAPLAVNLLCPLAGLQPVWKRLAHHESSGQYGHGGWLTYFSRSLEAFGPAVAVLGIVGTFLLLRNRRTQLVAGSIAVYFAAQTVIRALGLYDSGGYARFLVGISPLVAIAALAGLTALLTGDGPRRVAAALAVAAAMGLCCFAMHRQIAMMQSNRDFLAEVPRLTQAVTAVNWTTIGLAVFALMTALVEMTARPAPPSTARFVRPLMPLGLAIVAALTCRELCYPLYPPNEQPIVDDTLAWLKDHGHDPRQLISAVVWIDYKTGRAYPPAHPTLREQLEAAPIGTVFAWDRQFAGCPDHKLQLEEFEDSPAWREILVTAPLPNRGLEPYLFLFEKVGPWGSGKSARPTS